MADVLVLALAAAVYPTLLAGVVVILTLPRPQRALAAFLLGGMAMSVSAGLVILLVLDGIDANGRARHTVAPAVHITVGLLSLAVATVLWRRVRSSPMTGTGRDLPDGEVTPSRLQRALKRDSAIVVFAAGVVLNLPGAWYLAALNEISDAHDDPLTDVLLVVAFNAIMFVLVEIPLVGYVVAPERTAQRVRAFDAWLRTYSRQLAAAIAAAIGVYLVAKGVAAAVR
jgi:hypothetical protein